MPVTDFTALGGSAFFGTAAASACAAAGFTATTPDFGCAAAGLTATAPDFGCTAAGFTATTPDFAALRGLHCDRPTSAALRRASLRQRRLRLPAAALPATRPTWAACGGLRRDDCRLRLRCSLHRQSPWTGCAFACTVLSARVLDDLGALRPGQACGQSCKRECRSSASSCPPYLFPAGCPGLPADAARRFQVVTEIRRRHARRHHTLVGRVLIRLLRLGVAGLRVEATSRLDTFTMRSSLPTRSKNPSIE